jgi:CRP-like cAMP-binding protein
VLAVSRAELANLANMTTSNAIRTLSAFVSEGLIEVNKRKITIINVSALNHISTHD